MYGTGYSAYFTEDGKDGAIVQWQLIKDCFGGVYRDSKSTDAYLIKVTKKLGIELENNVDKWKAEQTGLIVAYLYSLFIYIYIYIY